VDWLDKRVFITGATGLVGTALTAHLLRLGARVTVLVRDLLPDKPCTGCTIVRGDIREPGLVGRILNEYSSQIVFHLAAQTQVTLANRSPLETLMVNIGGAMTVLDAVSRSSWVERCIVASSDKAYGTCDVLPYTEETPLRGRYPYDASKSCADILAQSYQETFDLPIAITRCANIYGGGDLNWQRLIPVQSRRRWRAMTLSSVRTARCAGTTCTSRMRCTHTPRWQSRGRWARSTSPAKPGRWMC